MTVVFLAMILTNYMLDGVADGAIRQFINHVKNSKNMSRNGIKIKSIGFNVNLLRSLAGIIPSLGLFNKKRYHCSNKQKYGNKLGHAHINSHDESPLISSKTFQ